MPRFSCKARPAALTGFICTLVMVIPTAADTEGGFRILSEQEADAHRQTMASMTESAREAYRNAQYAQLRQRAAANGYSLPATPPWLEHTAVRAESVGGDDNMQADIIARHAAMRARLEAHRRATRLAPTAATTDEAGETATHEAAPTEAADVAPTNIADYSTDAPAAESARQSLPAAAGGQPDDPATATLQADERPAQATASTTTDGTSDNGDTAPAVASPVTVSRPAPPRPPVMPTPPRAPASPVPTTGRTGANSHQSDASAETMAAYREQMRTKFDDYMKERQAQQDQSLRRQREQREAQMQQNRTWFQSGPRIPPYPYPSARSYSPRYPLTPPAYRSPYWQPQR